jgi:hypothetical protein
MSPFPNSINDISNAIQLALGPVFLLTGVAGLLNVMSGRLSRIIDRGRFLTEDPQAKLSIEPNAIQRELGVLEKRRNLTSMAITMCTFSALFVCMVIVTLFLEVMVAIPFNWIIGAFFSLATLALVVGLAYFLREVHLSSRTIRFNPN